MRRWKHGWAATTSRSPDHLTRLAGTINYPTKGKRKRGYVAELVTLHINLHAPAYTVEQLTSLTSKPRSQFGSDAAKPGRNDDQLRALLGASRMDGHWHNSMRAAIATMIGRGWSDDAIRFTCKRYCRDGYDDPDIAPLIDGARRKWDKPGNSDAQTGAADSFQSRPPRFLTLDEWRERALPMPDHLLGETFSTTCRAIMSAPTGLGKSNVTIAIGMRMAAGLPFLHWAGRRSARVLYIDGEMSRRLLRQRLLAEETRLFAEVSDQVREQFKPSGFHALSTEDIPDFQPLNTAMGQAVVEELVAEIGGCDFIIFDNVMSLISGSMVDEEAWAQTLPWAKSLTKRGIGQLWVHHTGHDETKGYGTKTREWQMDVVIHLTKVERADTDVSFKLEFRKARERRPDNGADFQEVNISLVDDQWVCDAASRASRIKVSPMATKFLEALQNVVAGGEQLKSRRLHGCHAVHSDDWKAECELLGLLDSKGQKNSQRAKFSKYRSELVAANKIACEAEHTWIK